MVKEKEQNINNRHTDFLPKLTFYIFAEDEYPIYQQQKNIHTIYRQINDYTIYQQIKKKLL